MDPIAPLNEVFRQSVAAVVPILIYSADSTIVTITLLKIGDNLRCIEWRHRERQAWGGLERHARGYAKPVKTSRFNTITSNEYYNPRLAL